jgi:hypothetical protein
MKRALYIFAAGLSAQFAAQWAAGRWGDRLHRIHGRLMP